VLGVRPVKLFHGFNVDGCELYQNDEHFGNTDETLMRIVLLVLTSFFSFSETDE